MIKPKTAFLLNQCYNSLLMEETIKKIDKLRKLIKDKEQLILLSQIRKSVKQGDKYSGKLCDYFSDTLDGMEPEVSARELGLL